MTTHTAPSRFLTHAEVVASDVIAFCAPSEKDEPATKDEPGS